LPKPDTLRDHPRFGHWLRRVSDPRLRALRRRTVALGAALGAVFCVIPLPVQIPMAVLAAILFRANLPAAVAATLLSNPVTNSAIRSLHAQVADAGSRRKPAEASIRSRV
jgi:uncharacterized protein (DUF2062 family)